MARTVLDSSLWEGAPTYSPDEYIKTNIMCIEDGGRSKFNPTPGTGRTAFTEVAPNNYPFYNDDEKYVPVIQADGAQLSEWKPRYAPSPEQEEIDRTRAYETGIPHGFVPKGDAYNGLPTIPLRVVSELHDDHEYGDQADENGRHCGGPFWIELSPKMRVEDVRLAIHRKSGIIPGLMRLMYAGKRMLDDQRTLEHYGVAYWQAKFPDWPLVITRY